MIPVSSFDFHLPEDLIAQESRPRGASRLLVVDRRRATWREMTIADLPAVLDHGDLMVANDTRVFPARLIGRRDPSGGRAECLLLEPSGPTEWLALVHPGQKIKPGTHLVFEDEVRAPGVRLTATIQDQRFFGKRLVTLTATGATTNVDDAIDRLGHIPLPPYIRRPDRTDDRERYQTVYARERGSIAAPTAGLHFTDALVDAIRAAGIGWETITLHVGYGTFKPVRAEFVEEHQVDAERFSIPVRTAAAILATRQQRKRVVAVGTTTTRALESATAKGPIGPGAGETELFISPGHEFKAVDALLTNFHLPRSSLLMLVAAFAGHDLTMAAYRDAVARGFHFYSYGDAMLIL